MRTFTLSLAALAALFALGVLLGPAGQVVAQGGAEGRAVFEAEKCGLCHGVQGAGIEAKTTSDKLMGPDLTGYEPPPGVDVGAFLRKQVEIKGIAHRREFKGTDEELQALLDWLASTG